MRLLGLLGATAILIFAPIQTAIAADIGYLTLCADNLQERVDESPREPITDPSSVNSWDDLVEYAYDEYLTNDHEDQHVSALRSALKGSSEERIAGLRFLAQSKHLSPMTKHVLLEELAVTSAEPDSEFELLVTEAVIPFYRRMACDECVERRLESMLVANQVDRFDLAQIARLYEIGATDDGKALAALVEQGCGQMNLAVIDLVALIAWDESQSTAEQSEEVKNFVRRASGLGAPRASHYQYMIEGEEDESRAVQLFSQALKGGSSPAVLGLARRLHNYKEQSEKTVIVAHFLAQLSAYSGEAISPLQTVQIRRLNEMDHDHWSLSIDGWTYAALAGDQRDTEMITRWVLEATPDKDNP
ncbi:MAG: hypothetical protein AAFR75_00280 [Pseudomonadota bacterium]